MPGRGARVVEEPESDPAGVELGLDPLLVAICAMRPHHGVGCLGVTSVEELPGHEAAFHPPLVAIDQDFGIARHIGQQLGGLLGLVGPAEELHAREDVGRFAPKVGWHRVEELACVSGLAGNGRSGLH